MSTTKQVGSEHSTHTIERGWRFTVIALFVAFSAASALAQSTFYVDAHATGANDGSSWCDAYIHLQDALATAQGSDGIVNEILVANGTYTPDQGAAQTPGDRTATFELFNGLTLRGGYAGCGAVDPNACDCDTFETILSGDLNGDDSGFFDNIADNSHHVVTANDVENDTILEGLTISGGNANVASSGVSAAGSGMLMHNSSPFFFQVRFVGNVAGEGGGLLIGGGSPMFVRCAFERNKSPRGGGFSYAYGGIKEAMATFVDCDFTENQTSVEGGAGNIKNARATFLSCRFTHNLAVSDTTSTRSTEQAATTLTYPGAAVLKSSFGDISFHDCVFEDNVGEIGPGGIFAQFSDALFSDCEFNRNLNLRGTPAGVQFENGDVRLIRCSFHHQLGSAVSIGSADLSAIDCSFVSNVGGGIGLSHGDLTVESCLFRDNASEGVNASHSNVRITDSLFERNTGGIFIRSCKFVVLDCDLIGNHTDHGGGLSIRSSEGHLERLLIAGNFAEAVGGAINIDSSVVDLRNSLIVANESNSIAGAISTIGLDVLIAETTIAFNNTVNADSAAVVSDGLLELRNAILWGNSAGDSTDESAQLMVYEDFGGPAKIAYNTIQGWTGKFGGLGNNGDDPLFIDADGPDDILGNEDDDFHLSMSSPAANTGDPAVTFIFGADDLAGHDRRTSCRIDRGAFESNVIQAKGDFDGNGQWDLRDVAALELCISGGSAVEDWERACSCVFNQVSPSGVDLADFAALVGQLTGPE